MEERQTLALHRRQGGVGGGKQGCEHDERCLFHQWAYAPESLAGTAGILA